MEKLSILIVGAGLAGTSLAQRLLEKQQQVTLFDSGQNNSTAIAAGIINPMVFRRMNKSWRVDDFLKEAIAYYKNLEDDLNIKLIRPLFLRRLFSSLQEKEFWEKRQFEKEYSAYLEILTAEDLNYSLTKNDFGSGRVKQAFWIEAQTYYTSQINYFDSLGLLLKENFSKKDFNAEGGIYKDILYDKIIFCCGSNNGEMPYFSDIPIEKTKGQTLTISCKDLPENESLNRKTFVLPLENNTFKIGATYEWEDGSLNTTKEARELLLENFSVISDLPIKVIDQVAGIRPTVLDRRPVLGQHKIHKKLFIFNGLGAKGYLMAPTLAREMAEYILGEGTISKEVSINRFY